MLKRMVYDFDDPTRDMQYIIVPDIAGWHCPQTLEIFSASVYRASQIPHSNRRVESWSLHAFASSLACRMTLSQSQEVLLLF
jgi:hypothetical protein